MKNNAYLPTIGLEIHVQLKTRSKMFCGCENNSWKIGLEEIKPNTAICPVCTGQPGSLPVINNEAVKMAVKAGLALNCTLAKKSKFDRKNYFYPDLPKGYQISQYDEPLCKNGKLEIENHRRGENNTTVGITRIHLEEDTARSIHPSGQKYSLIDFNRSGIPLMELVTKPDLHTAYEAKEFCQELQQIFKSLKISDAAMEKSQMRCEVNISLAPKTQITTTSKLGAKVEIKNLNSFKSVERSIEYEILRQSKLLSAGKKIISETRGWHEKEQKTIVQRSKEEAHDYRYFPEPDLEPIKFDQAYINKIKKESVEFPRAKIERFEKQYAFLKSDARILIANPDLADFAENVMSELRVWLVDLDEMEFDEDVAWQKHKKKLSKLTANWLINKLGGLLIAQKLTITSSKISPENFAEFITLIYKSRVNAKTAQNLLNIMLKTGGDPSDILEDEGLYLLENVADLEPIVDKVIRDNPRQVKEFQAGKQTLIKFFIGRTMKESRGKADPKMAEEIFLQKLS
ncbi:Asp-tRNA(Asn)/Glu-tRNA(Gln) amidotransferase GatCAB subunit B [Candidatus Kuenenbacteria bacterium CG11_big_fil_rev_8_21_14_0_20_37_9]|nr:MAG: Asp-tRNA(Asn)/Glu-tRNA(Gln) amidotransferase GatCAB subunit B [Candidatus Kuenenbacteria bacterium CG11_big_fil_rev_8_21_14_0_20_37_9]